MTAALLRDRAFLQDRTTGDSLMTNFRHAAPRLAIRLAALVVAALLSGCAQTTPEPMLSPAAAADFALPDVNPNSVSFGRPIAVRDYEGWVSAWYFGHAT